MDKRAQDRLGIAIVSACVAVLMACIAIAAQADARNGITVSQSLHNAGL